MWIMKEACNLHKKEGISSDRCYKTVEALIEAEKKMAADKRIEVVAIVTPNALHFPFAKSLL